MEAILNITGPCHISFVWRRYTVVVTIMSWYLLFFSCQIQQAETLVEGNRW